VVPSEQLGPASQLPGGVEDPSEKPAAAPAQPDKPRATGDVRELDEKGIEQLEDAPSNTEKPPEPEPSLSMLRTRLSMQESTVAEVEAKFRSTLDKDQDGGIDLPEFLLAMPELGQHSPALAKRLFAVFDHDRSGKISVEELVGGLASLCEGEVHEKVRFVFALYDSDNDGFVTKAELHGLLKSYFGGKAAISAQTVECFDLEDIEDLEAEDAGKQVDDSQGKYDVLAQLDGSVDDFVNQIFEGDSDKDGKLSLAEFETWLQKETTQPSAAGTVVTKWAELLAGAVK